MRIALVLLLAAHAEAQSAHVEIAGDSRLRDAIVSQLAAQGVSDGPGANVVGRYHPRRGRLELTVSTNGETHDVQIQQRSRDRLAELAVSRIHDLLAAPSATPNTSAHVPDPPRSHRQVVSSAAPNTVSSEPLPSTQPALRMWIGGQIYTRALSYRDDIFDRLASYELAPGLAGHAGFEWYPLRHLSREAWANFGLSGFARTMALDSSGNGQGASYGTHASAWELDLRYSLPIDAHAITLGMAYGEEIFGIDPPLSGNAAARGTTSPVPSVHYRYLRPFLQAEVYLLEGLSVGASFGWRVLLATGELGSSRWFPRNRGTGLDLGLFVSYRVTWFFEVRLSGEHHRYYFSLNPQPGDWYVAGGATDEWLSLSLELAIRIPEVR